ncbi:MAG: ATP-binding protein [Nitrosospira sp.]|nr:ATP-binding protein [Nitrosospira sp.]
MTTSPPPEKSWQATADTAAATHPGSFWRSLFYFNVYRLLMAGGIITITWLYPDSSLGSYNPLLFLYTALAYIVFGGISLLLARMQRLHFDRQLAIQISGDVLFVTILMYSSGGIQSGLGPLLLAPLAAAGLISRGRLALFYASIASIGILLEESYSLLHVQGYQAQYLQAGLLSLGYFAVAWLAHKLAKYTTASEQLALQRAIDLASMAEVNQLVIQDMQDGVLVVDENGKIQQHNPQAGKLIGLTPELSAAPLLAEHAPALAMQLAAWRANGNIDFDLLRMPVNDVSVRVRFVPVKGDGRINTLIFLEDVSRIQVQAQQLKLAALGRLTANIAHEIRNPLSAIGHAAELLEEEKSSDPTQMRLLRIIRDNTQRLDKIVQNVLELNRRDRATPEALHLAGFMHTFVADFCHAEKVSSDIFVLDISDRYVVNFDRGHLNQVLWNLCHNALRYCRKQPGSIRLKVTEEVTGNHVNLDVIDDGPGIPPALLSQSFEPFFTTAAGGTGLGLYIAREMCKANGAALDCLENATGGHFRIVCRKSVSHV